MDFDMNRPTSSTRADFIRDLREIGEDAARGGDLEDCRKRAQEVLWQFAKLGIYPDPKWDEWFIPICTALKWD
jgi:hypothetical protein